MDKDEAYEQDARARVVEFAEWNPAQHVAAATAALARGRAMPPEGTVGGLTATYYAESHAHSLLALAKRTVGPVTVFSEE